MYNFKWKVYFDANHGKPKSIHFIGVQCEKTLPYPICKGLTCRIVLSMTSRLTMFTKGNIQEGSIFINTLR